MPRSPESVRKAALLVATLDQQTADALLDQMTEAEADLVRRAAVAIDIIDSAEQEAVIREFLGRPAESPQSRAASEPRLPANPPTSVPPRGSQPPFRFLHQAHPDQLLPFLQGEHPQTIAVVVSHLPPERSSRLLSLLPSSLQADVLERLVHLEEMHPEILRELESGLESRIAQIASNGHRRASGLAAVESILSASDRRGQRRMLENLEQHAPQLARQLDQPAATLEFDDLHRLSDEHLRRLFAEADPHLVTLAMAGATPEFVDRVMGLVPQHEQQALRSAWDRMGPTPLGDIDAAQSRLAELAMRLDREGLLLVA